MACLSGGGYNYDSTSIPLRFDDIRHDRGQINGSASVRLASQRALMCYVTVTLVILVERPSNRSRIVVVTTAAQCCSDWSRLARHSSASTAASDRRQQLLMMSTGVGDGSVFLIQPNTTPKSSPDPTQSIIETQHGKFITILRTLLQKHNRETARGVTTACANPFAAGKNKL